MTAGREFYCPESLSLHMLFLNRNIEQKNSFTFGGILLPEAAFYPGNQNGMNVNLYVGAEETIFKEIV